MTAAEWVAAAAVALCALSVLPGSLGVLSLTNTFAASALGSRLVYGNLGLRVALSALALGVSLVLAASSGFSPIVLAGVAAFAGILAFGSVMHTGLMFRPIRRPSFVSVDQAIAKFGPGEEVIGVTDKAGIPFAFITRLARRPHIVYQPDGSHPFVMTHCILSHSSMGYRAEGEFSRPEFSVAAALANNLVIYDKNRECAISQIQNRSRDGRTELETLPTIATSLGSWKALYPDSKVWVRPPTWRDAFFLKVLSRADIINPSNPSLMYPLQHPHDERLPLKSEVVGVRVNDAARAYPAHLFREPQAINDTLGDRPILVASAFAGDYIQVFDRELDGKILEFRPEASDDGFVDRGSGSQFRPNGHCSAGSFAGQKLSVIPHFNKVFWFPWADYFPDTEVYHGGSDGEIPSIPNGRQ